MDGLNNDVKTIVSRYTHEYNFKIVLNQLLEVTYGLQYILSVEIVRRCSKCKTAWTCTRCRQGPICFACAMPDYVYDDA